MYNINEILNYFCKSCIIIITVSVSLLLLLSSLLSISKDNSSNAIDIKNITTLNYHYHYYGGIYIVAHWTSIIIYMVGNFKKKIDRLNESCTEKP